MSEISTQESLGEDPRKETAAPEWLRSAMDDAESSLHTQTNTSSERISRDTEVVGIFLKSLDKPGHVEEALNYLKDKPEPQDVEEGLLYGAILSEAARRAQEDQPIHVNGGISLPIAPELSSLVNHPDVIDRSAENGGMSRDVLTKEDKADSHEGSRFPGWRGLSKGQRKEALLRHREPIRKTLSERKTTAFAPAGETTEAPAVPSESVLQPLAETLQPQATTPSEKYMGTALDNLRDFHQKQTTDEELVARGELTSAGMEQKKKAGFIGETPVVTTSWDKGEDIQPLKSYSNDNTGKEPTLNYSTDNSKYPDRHFGMPAVAMHAEKMATDSPEKKRSLAEVKKIWASKVTEPIIESEKLKKLGTVVKKAGAALTLATIVTGITVGVAGDEHKVMAELPTSVATAPSEEVLPGPEKKVDIFEKLTTLGKPVVFKDAESFSQSMFNELGDEHMSIDDFNKQIYTIPERAGGLALANLSLLLENHPDITPEAMLGTIKDARGGDEASLTQVKNWLNLVHPGQKGMIYSIADLDALSTDLFKAMDEGTFTNTGFRIQTPEEDAVMRQESKDKGAYADYQEVTAKAHPLSEEKPLTGPVEEATQHDTLDATPGKMPGGSDHALEGAIGAAAGLAGVRKVSRWDRFRNAITGK